MKRPNDYNLDSIAQVHLPFPCKCGLHEEGKKEVSERIIRQQFKTWKVYIESCIEVPNAAMSMQLHCKLHVLKQHMDMKSFYHYLTVWGQSVVAKKSVFFKECRFTLLCWLKSTVLSRYPYIRKHIVKSYMEESGELRFPRWLTFILGALHSEEYNLKKIKL